MGGWPLYCVPWDGGRLPVAGACLRRDQRAKKRSSVLIAAPPGWSVSCQRFRIGTIADALFEHPLDVMLGDKGSQGIAYQLGHRDCFDDRLRRLGQAFAF